MNDEKNILTEQRKQQVFDLVEVYTNRYTAAQFCDWQADIDRYSDEANVWFRAQRAANNITGEEVAEALSEISKIAVRDGKPLYYDDNEVK
jgi:hypothetical protein